MAGVDSIRSIQTLQPLNAAAPTPRPRPTAVATAQPVGDQAAIRQSPSGKAMKTVDLGTSTFKARWQKLDNAEKFFVGLQGGLGAAAIVGGAVAGAKGAIRSSGLKGAVIGAGVGAAATVATPLVMDVLFTQGSMVTTKAVGKLTGLKK